MKRDPRVYLWDMREAAAEIAGFTTAWTGRATTPRPWRAWPSNASSRSLARLDPALAARIPNFRQVIAFRNVLIHGYRRIDHDELWRRHHRAARPAQRGRCPSRRNGSAMTAVDHPGTTGA